jgi:Na+-driven multidrug efflux pump|nr:hypothetical protein [Cloacibacillus porcorum]
MFLVWRFTLPILRFFDASAELLSIGDCAMRVVSAGHIFTAYMLIAQSVCQALGNELYCLVVMLLRVVVVLLPLPRHCSRQSSSARGRQLPLRVRCSAVPF